MARLTIYFTSDTHGYLYNTTFAGDRNTEKPMGLLGMTFPRDENTLVIDGGDTLQGSPLTFYLKERNISDFVSEVMNERGFQYVTLGNHDFNYGPEWLGTYLGNLKATCLCANVRDLEGRLPLKPCEVVTLGNGLRVGLFGIVTDWVNLWEKPENLTTLRVTDPMEAARSAVSELQREGCDVIVGIYHGGVEKDLEDGHLLSQTDENIACRLCEELSIDLLLTGHQHIAMADRQWHGTHLCQTPCNALQYVKAELLEDGTWHSELLTPMAHQAWSEREEQIRDEVETWLDQPIGHLSRDIWPEDKLQMALHGSPIADFFNMVQLWASGADISLTCLGNEVRGFSKHVTVRDVVASYTYSNTLVILEATGKQIREAIEQTATYFAWEDGQVTISESFLKPKAAHFNYDYFAGVNYVVDLTRPEGHRVTSLTRDGRELRDDEVFTVCLNNYRATGAGEYPMWTEAKRVREIQREISELILEYLKEHDFVEIPDASPFRTVT